MPTDTAPPPGSVEEIEAELAEAQRAAEAAAAEAAARVGRVLDDRARLAKALHREAAALYPSLAQFWSEVSDLSGGSFSPFTVRNVLQGRLDTSYAAAVLSYAVSALARARTEGTMREAA